MIGLFAEAPALPLHSAGKFVAAAYIFAFLVILVYVAIMGARLTHSHRELAELRAELDARGIGDDGGAGTADLDPGSTLSLSDQVETETQSQPEGKREHV